VNNCDVPNVVVLVITVNFVFSPTSTVLIVFRSLVNFGSRSSYSALILRLSTSRPELNLISEE
jgi:hypothetical protein